MFGLYGFLCEIIKVLFERLSRASVAASGTQFVSILLTGTSNNCLEKEESV